MYDNEIISGAIQMHKMDSSNTKVMASLNRDAVNQRGTSQFPRAMHNPRAMDSSMVYSQHMAVNPSSTLL
jgi:hypothetical protein